MPSTAVTDGLQAVFSALDAAWSARRISSLEGSYLRRNIERYWHQMQLGPGGLRAYARELGTLVQEPVAKIVPGDYVFRSYPHENWRHVVWTFRKDDIVQLVYRDGQAEQFATGVKLMRIFPTEPESALHDLAGDPKGERVFTMKYTGGPGDILHDADDIGSLESNIAVAVERLREGAVGAVALIWEAPYDEETMWASWDWRRLVAFRRTGPEGVVAIAPSYSGIEAVDHLDKHKPHLWSEDQRGETLLRRGPGRYETADGAYRVERRGRRWIVRSTDRRRNAEEHPASSLDVAREVVRSQRERAHEGVVKPEPKRSPRAPASPPPPRPPPAVPRAPRRLPDEQIRAFLAEHPGWRHDNDGLQRYVTFDRYDKAVAFVGRVGAASEKHNHHAQMRIDPVGRDGPGVAVGWTTHSLGGVTDLDVLMAETTERLTRG